MKMSWAGTIEGNLTRSLAQLAGQGMGQFAHLTPFSHFGYPDGGGGNLLNGATQGAPVPDRDQP